MLKKTVTEIHTTERRRARRVPIELIIQYHDLEQFCQDYARNLSLGGIFIETRKPLSVGMTLQLSFSLPEYDGVIETMGRVVRSISPELAQSRGVRPGMAVKFDDLPENQKRVIDSLVQRAYGEDGEEE